MKKHLSTLSLLAVAGLTLAGCESNSSTASSSTASSNSDTLTVVTSTDVYADIVEAVGGDLIDTTPIIASTAVDPHSYEATSQDRLTVKDADLVLINGGGYDSFLEHMAQTDNPDQVLVDAVKLSGLFSEEDLAHMAEEHAAHEGETEEEHAAHVHSYNEHVWYDLETMQKTALQVAEELGKLDSANAETYKASAAEFSAQIDELIGRVAALNTSERTYIATEPVPGYLLEDAGYTDVTPSDLIAAVDSDSDIAPLTMQETKDAITGGTVDLLAYNEQTQTAQTTEIYTFAQDSNVAAISFTETLPENTGFLDWMKANIDNLEKAEA
ncbi:metal ABC transporter solute-binding protein, Zn/Mn family [Rothia nasimurium]|uniref:metal ABC transporter solute-binding protein, Zn/Mn family n=1 Tax=Rothia nasimurium TaxID=85336 RepID=UPI003B9EAF99